MPIPTPTAQASPHSAIAKDASSPLAILGGLLLLVAVGAAAMLAAHRLGGLAIPGCGGGGACDKVTKGPWGSIPWLHWPVSYVGAAYFLGMLVAWLSVRGRPTSGMRWLARLGAVASVMFVGVMLSENTICPYCLTAHGANLLFVIICELAGRAGWGARAGVPTAVAVASMVTAVLGMAELRQHEENALDMATSIEKMKATMADQGNKVAKPAGPPATGAGTTGEFTGRYRLGPADAPIKIVMFTDYGCPDCRHFEAQAMELLKERSDISLSIKHFPFCTDCNKTPNVPNLHPNSCWAARAAETAGKLYGPAGFWKMHSWLFENKGAFTDETFPPGLASLGFEPMRFQQVMKEVETLVPIQADIEEAESLGIRSTPMMFVNVVEVKGWGSDPNALRHAVEAIKPAAVQPAAPQPGGAQPATGASGPKPARPPTAAEKDAAEAADIIDGWRDPKKTPAMAWPMKKVRWVSLPDTVPVRIQLWGDLLEPNCAAADKTIRDAIAGRSDIQYEFRYFPFDQACNPTLPKTMFPGACRAAKTAEAAGQLGASESRKRMEAWLREHPDQANDGGLAAAAAGTGLDAQALLAKINAGPRAPGDFVTKVTDAAESVGGIDAYWKMHIWIMEHQKAFSDASVKAVAPSMGLDPAALIAKVESPEVGAIVSNDAGIGYRIGIPEIPRIFFNGKLLPRWNIPNQFMIERVIEETARPPAPPQGH